MKRDTTMERLPGHMNITSPEMGAVGIQDILIGDVTAVIFAKNIDGEYRSLLWTIPKEDLAQCDAQGFGLSFGVETFNRLKAAGLIQHDEQSLLKRLQKEADELWRKSNTS